MVSKTVRNISVCQIPKKSLFHLRSRHRYGILARVWSPPHQEEVDAAGAEPAQGHLLHVEQAQDRLDQAEEEDIDIDIKY